ncbi:hypothetical protein [Thioclava sp. SK-1]|uniref:hypothetical protein n=1 Tax=Thioclava sp. SK-1 TaxID=1889770 RepID=UPI0009F1A1EA|nr:hypothetical protein [Thioclava sp. SK-1]
MLCALLAVTSLQMAVARGQARVAGQIVLCTGTGVTTVHVDAQGQPIDRPQICPDMALNWLVAVDMAQQQPRRPDTKAHQINRPDTPLLIAQTQPHRRARDPPALS